MGCGEETSEEREARKERYRRYARGERNDLPHDTSPEAFSESSTEDHLFSKLWPLTVALVVGGTFYMCVKAPEWLDAEPHYCDPMHNDKSVT